MKKNNPGLFIMSGVIVALAITLVSFSTPFGGDSFTIHLNNKLIMKKYVYGEKAVKTIELKQSNSEDELRISYSHCGVVGKERVISIKDQNDRVLRLWKFSNQQSSMKCKVKDILGLEKKDISLRLFYSSSELPKGYELASIVTDNRSLVKK